MQTNANNEHDKFIQHTVAIKQVDDEKRVVYAEVYAPYTVDVYGDMMTKDDIALMAHRYLQRTDLGQTIDTQHDNVPNGSYPIESFIARKGDPDYTEGAWVLGVKIVDEMIWSKIKKGDINGFSMESLVKIVPAVVDMVTEDVTLGITEESEGHKHFFFIQRDSEGRVIGGRTSVDLGHAHEIRLGTATENHLGHAHRFFLQ